MSAFMHKLYDWITSALMVLILVVTAVDTAMVLYEAISGWHPVEWSFPDEAPQEPDFRGRSGQEFYLNPYKYLR